MLIRSLFVAAMTLLAVPAFAQTAHPRAAEITRIVERLQEAVGGAAALQKAYEDARAQQARLDGALALIAVLEPAFRASSRADVADLLVKGRDSLGTLQEPTRQRYQRLAALDTSLDEAAAQAAYDRVWSVFAAALKQPAADQYKVYLAEGRLDTEAAKAGQMIADLILAAADGKTKQPS